MDIVSWPKKITETLKKYKYVAIILLAGLLLMAIPDFNTRDSKNTVETVPETQTDMNEALAEILGKIEGAGEVQVLLTVRRGEETLYQTNTNSSVEDTASATKVETVLMTTSAKEEAGLIRQINPPLFMGAIVVCRGGDIPSVRLAIVDAVSKVTGLGSDCISVLKMK